MAALRASNWRTAFEQFRSPSYRSSARAPTPQRRDVGRGSGVGKAQTTTPPEDSARSGHVVAHAASPGGVHTSHCADIGVRSALTEAARRAVAALSGGPRAGSPRDVHRSSEGARHSQRDGLPDRRDGNRNARLPHATSTMRSVHECVPPLQSGLLRGQPRLAGFESREAGRAQAANGSQRRGA